jgi:glycosyltransferase involved in cell wall biosynthesis
MSHGRPLPLVGCILTLDEEQTIGRAVDSLRRVADAVVVVDSGSTDETIARARAHRADVVVNPFESYPRQRNWALDHLHERFGPCWVITLDADEWLGDGLTNHLRQVRSQLTADHECDVYLLARRTRFSGRVLRFGGFGRTWLARLIRSDVARYGDRPVNEHLDLPARARMGRLSGWLEHDDVRDWSRYIDKHNRYSTLEAQARVAARSEPSSPFAPVRHDPTRLRQVLRQRVYDRLPARPLVRFVTSYLVLGGFLDGRAGFNRSLFEAWQEMCIDLKSHQIDDERRSQPDPMLQEGST